MTRATQPRFDCSDERTPMSSSALLAADPVVLRGVSWTQYVRLRNHPENQPVRMTYSKGALEIVPPSHRHERVAQLIGRLIQTWTEIRQIPIQSAGSTTCRLKELEAGLEPDGCLYIKNEAQMRAREELDLEIDPPPDLAIEVEVTRRMISRLPIYSGLGIPEVWCWWKDELQFLRLTDQGYLPCEQSAELRGFPRGLAIELLARRLESSETELLLEFRRRATAESR